MKDASKVILVDTGKRRKVYLVPIFLAALIIGFLLELVIYESLTFSEIGLAISSFPARWYQARNSWKFMPPPPLQASQEVDDEQEKLFEDVSSTTVSEKTLQLWEQPTLLNLNNFTWIMNNASICKVDNSKETRLMPIMVHTARQHFDERVALRKSIGSLPPYKKWVLRLVFLLGEADRGSNPQANQQQFENQEKQLRDEQKKYGDLVIGSYIDSYHNLTYKHLSAYKWILNFCQDAKFVLKIDDDMFIDILRWLDWRTADLEKKEKDKDAKIPDLYCHTFGGTKPIREPKSKWYASPEDWPDDYYPDYCSGWAYGITVELIKKLYSATNDIKFFWVDDVFATGALMEVAKKKFNFKPDVKHIWGNVTSDIKEYRPFCQKGSMDAKREFRAVAYIPRGEFFERDMMCMFNKTLHDSNYKFS